MGLFSVWFFSRRANILACLVHVEICCLCCPGIIILGISDGEEWPSCVIA